MMKFQKRQISAVVLSAATLCSVPLAPLALAEEGLALEEVLVTARKRMESLQDAPLSVSAITGDTLVDAGITNLADITEMVPNLQIARPSKDANVYIRGVGPARGATNVTELSVGVYIDDVFMLKPQGQLIDLAEIESVQVLRGPQGTLFGKNTTGGAMVVTTVKPNEEFGGFGKVTVGNNGRLNVQGSIDVPLGDSFLTKLTLTSVEIDGIGKDPVHGTELSNEDRQGALLQLRWLASEDVTADFSFFHNRIRENVLANGDCVVTNTNAQIPGRGLIAPSTGFKSISDFCEDASDGVATYHDPDPSRVFDLDATQASMNVTWDITEDHSLKSITAWRTQETPGITYTNTYAGYPAGQRVLDDSESTQISQEFQFSGEFLDGDLRYTTGLYYMQDDSDTGLVATWQGDEGVWASSIAEGIPPGFVFALTGYSEVGQETDNSTAAVYTQWSWDATENLELTVGLRYGYEEREIETERTKALTADQAFADVPGAIPLPDSGGALMTFDTFFNNSLSALPLPMDETGRLQDDETYDSLTPMVTAAYNFPDEMLSDSINGLMMYASYTEGYKAGGFSDFALSELIPYDEEQIDSFEIGMKLDAWDNRMRINVAVFSMDYQDMQLFVARPDPDPNSIGSFQGVTNAGASSIDGAELEVSLVPAADWLISFSASFADGQFDQFDDFIVDPESGDVVPLDRSDEDLPSLPESSFSLGVQYDWDTNFGSWTARVDAYYRNEIYWGFDALTWDLPQARKESTTDSYTVYNARLNWRVTDGLSLSAWGKNLSDKSYYDGGVGESANIGHVIKGFAEPRRYGVDLRYEF
ncbi:MAG: TonB-dependent receptor [Halioglobus sp.]